MKITTAKGHELDIARIMAQNDKAIAVGNAGMNARGDILGAGGTITMRKEQLAMQSHNTERTVKTISLKELGPDDFMSPTEAMEKLTKHAAELAKDEPKSQKSNKGKIVDSE